jgi:CBS-domain-containing membrane protein
MSLPYKALPIGLAPAGTQLLQPRDMLPAQVGLDSPAVDSMTDLSRVAAASIDPDLTLDRAEERMKFSGVRLLFVLTGRRDLLGLITLNDIKGERPVRFQRDMGISHREIRVRDIMTPLDRLETIPWRDVADARVGDIIQTLKRTGRQHALVVERTVAAYVIRGIFSSTRISRQLGMPVETSGIAYTFAELEAALTH